MSIQTFFVSVAAGLLLSACGSLSSSDGQQYIDFAQCVTDAGWSMYGAERCSHCKKQKELFGSSFTAISYVECTEQEDVCTAAGVNGYPTWISQDGRTLGGFQSIEALSEASGCQVPG